MAAMDDPIRRGRCIRGHYKGSDPVDFVGNLGGVAGNVKKYKA